MATEVIFPMLSTTSKEGTILRWILSEGDLVEKGEPLFEIESDKVVIEVESPASGILRKILVPEKSMVPTLTVVAVITAEDEVLPEKYLKEGLETAEMKNAVGKTETVASLPADLSERKTSKQSNLIRAVPAAKKLAREYELDLSLLGQGSGPGGIILKKDVENHIFSKDPKHPKKQVTTIAKKLAEKKGITLAEVQGTGRSGKVVKTDVLKAIETQKLSVPRDAQTEAQFGTTIPVTSLRKVLASRVSQSAFTAPHISFFTEVHMQRLMELRREILEDFEAQFNARISINDFIIKAVGLTICEYPILNGTLEGANIIIHDEINVGLAVALEEGLIVPAISRADCRGLGEIAKMREDLVERARDRKLRIEEIERGTFTVSSLAHFDILFFTAIINPPQCGILSVGKTDEKISLVDGKIVVKPICHFGLSADHRIVDGAVAAAFLQSLKKKLENPSYGFLQL
jgi:pyruvate dehydrogenase E2 component (dihydrolipoamide acetyltransferase)